MTFKHKLSRRLALLYAGAAAAAALAVAACELAMPLSEPSGEVAQLVIFPKTATVQRNETVSFTSVGLTAQGDTVELLDVVWTATGGTVASAGASGNYKRHYGQWKNNVCGGYGVAATERRYGKADTASVTVACPVASVAVTPATGTVLAGETLQLTAMPTDTAGNAVTGASVTWTSSNRGVATVGATGLVTGVAAGSATITAASGGQTGSAVITVTAPPPAPVAAVTVSPAAASLLVGQTQQLAATTKDANGNTLTGRTVSWSTDNAAVASVSASGFVTALAPGPATITATSEGQSGTAAITVTAAPVPVASVAVSPAAASLQVGQTQQLTATPQDASGNALSGRTVTWSSSAPGTATVTPSGLVTAVAAGSATITATSEGKSGSAAITVTPVPVASVTVSPTSAGIQVGQTVQLTATTKDANGNILTGRPVSWSSSNSSVASVNTNGFVTAVAAGSATITATSEGKNGTSAITVTAPGPAPVATVAVSPASASLLVGQTQQLSATTKDGNGNILTGRTVSWSSSSSTVASVNSSGLVTGLAAGSATITATSEGKTGTSAITVTAPAPPPPTSGSCLARGGPVITLSGLSTSAYQNTSLATGTTIDATTAQWLLNTPDVWGYMGGGSSLCWHSGQILGTIPPSTPYEDNQNGYHLMYGVDVHSSGAIVEGLTIFTGGDGITFDASGDANWTVRDVHMTYIRDDCVENDYLNSGLVDNSFFDGCYDFMSARAYTSTGSGSGNTVTIQNSLIRAQAMDKLYPGLSPGFGGFFKWSGGGSPNTGDGPMLVLNNNVFRADTLPVEHNGAGLYMAPVPGKVKSCANNVMVWLGPGSFPEPLPSCFTLMTGQAGRDYWDQAVAKWKAAHPAPVDVAPPIVSLFSPGITGSATLTGTVSLVATAVDDQALAGVQFKLNGQSIGAEVTAPARPTKFVLSWDSRALPNGKYTLTATARDAAGHSTTSAGISVTIGN